MDGLPPVSQCQVEKCFYNINQLCHAPAINVGGEMHPACDTFIQRTEHIHRQNTALVGACHTSECRYNNDLTCSATGIVVTEHAGHADCGTFEA